MNRYEDECSTQSRRDAAADLLAARLEATTGPHCPPNVAWADWSDACHAAAWRVHNEPGYRLKRHRLVAQVAAELVETTATRGRDRRG